MTTKTHGQKSTDRGYQLFSDRKIERVVSVKEAGLTGGPGGGFSLAPDDSPLILRDTSVEEIYALDWEAP